MTNTALILDGKKTAEKIQENIRALIEQRKNTHQVIPCLVVVLVGDDPASKVYVNKKKSTCEAVGIRSHVHLFPSNTSEETLSAHIQTLNNDPEIHGILVQLPLPPHLSADTVIDAINPSKDVDGFHPINMGLLALKKPRLRPCTPKGIIRLLESTGIDLAGKEAVVLGTSNIVGRPVALELLMKNATVTLCNSKTQNLSEHVQRADILVAAIGKPNFVPGHWIKPGAIVIDVGINRLPNGKLTGDVDFEGASQKASWITQVPGGVGPMTVACLMENTLMCLSLIEKG